MDEGQVLWVGKDQMFGAGIDSINSVGIWGSKADKIKGNGGVSLLQHFATHPLGVIQRHGVSVPPTSSVFAV